MATAQQIIALLSSHVKGDQEQVLSIALQVAAVEARSGRKETAEQLRKLVQVARNAKSRQVPSSDISAIPIARPKGELQTVLSVHYPKTQLEDMALAGDTIGSLRNILEQQAHRERLRSFGKVPASRLLLAGPPGSGKTMTASVLAAELHVPLFAVRLDALITRYLGETASKMRLIFDHVASTRGVFLFDEFDAIGGNRGADNDVGEMRRVLNSFLQFMEEANSTDSMIVAATNHAELLDTALARRFDDVIVYGMPDEKAARKIIERHLGLFRPRLLQWSKLLDAANGLSHGEIARGVDDVIKRAILREATKVTSGDLQTALAARAIAKAAMFGKREA